MIAGRRVRFVRLTCRVGALAPWTILCAVALCVTPAIGVVHGSASRTWRRHVSRIYADGMARIIGMQVSVKGTPPSAPYVLVANHLSYIDIILLARDLGCIFVAKREVREWIAWGTLARLAGTIFLDRKSTKDTMRVISEIRRRTKAGDGVVLFPEGTSTRGDRVLPMKSALLESVAFDRAPVQYAAISYSTPVGERPADSAVCWWGDMTFGPHFLALLQMKSFNATISYGDAPMQGTDRKKLAKDLHRAVEMQLTSVAD